MIYNGHADIANTHTHFIYIYIYYKLGIVFKIIS